jgi:hypothetical protein
MFFGNGVQLYGAISSNHGLYSVSLDGGTATQYNGTAITFRPQMLLVSTDHFCPACAYALQYLASGLETGMHTVVVSNIGATYTDLDYAIVSQYGAAPATTTTTTSLPSASSAKAGPSRSHALLVGAVVGAVVGVIAILVIVGLSVCALARRRARRREASTHSHDIADGASGLNQHPPAPLPLPQVPHSVPQMEEVDLPPPVYGDVFPSEVDSMPASSA